MRRRGGGCDRPSASPSLRQELGPKPPLAKLREQQPDLAAGNKEVREALAALKAEESKAPEAAAAPPAAEERGAPPDVEISLACFGCARLPSEMGDGREKSIQSARSAASSRYRRRTGAT